jgi:hypothetical protein
MSLSEAKALLEENGYVFARRMEPGWEEKAFRLNDEFIAIKLIDGQPELLKPKELCDLIGIERHTLTRSLKHSDCPQVRERRGRKRRLVGIEPTQELITFLLRNK